MTATVQQSFKQLQNMSEPLSSDAIHAELKSKIAAAALDDAEAHRDIWGEYAEPVNSYAPNS